MPRLLDKRLIGYDLGDVSTHKYSSAPPGSVMRVSPDRKTMDLAPGNLYSYESRESDLNHMGIALQQYLCDNWVDITAGTGFTSVNGIAYGNGIFVAVGQNNTAPVIAWTTLVRIAGSTTVQTDWQTVSSPPFSSIIYGIAYGDGKFIACGNGGEIVISHDGETWLPANKVRQGFNDNLFRISYGEGKGWVSVGASYGIGVTLFSPDGVTWTKLTTSALDDSTYTGVPIYGLGYGQGKWVAVGGNYNIDTNHIATSTDGVTWTISTTPTAVNKAGFYTVEYGNGRWVAGGSGAGGYTSAITSTDGVTWSSQSTTVPPGYGTAGPLNHVQAIVFGNGAWVASGDNIWISVDGQNFRNTYPNATTPWTGSNLHSASCGAYGNGVFVLGSRTGQLLRSSVMSESNLLQGPTGPTGNFTGATGTLGWDTVGSIIQAYLPGNYNASNQTVGLYPSGTEFPANLLTLNATTYPNVFWNNAPNASYQTITGNWRLLGPTSFTSFQIPGDLGVIVYVNIGLFIKIS